MINYRFYMHLLLLSLLVFISSVVAAAEFPDISVKKDFNSRPLTELIEHVEAGHDLHFFYLKKWTDSIMVIQHATPSSLEKILNESLVDTELSYFIDNQKNIILSYQYQILSSVHSSLLRTELPEKKPGIILSEKSSFIMGRPEQVASERRPEEVITIGLPGDISRTSKAVVSGYVREKETGRPVPGAVVYVANLGIGTITDVYGYYVLSVPPGGHELLYKFLGRKDETYKVIVNGNGMLDVVMEERLIELWGAVITADKEQNVRGLQIGLDKLDIQTIRHIPSNLGEADVIKSTLLLPGVQTVGEGASGFNVRGGNTDHNLILMDGAPLFNSSHMFGFFSVFNPEIVKEFKLYKSGIPAKYGGRLSSVLDVTLRNGDLKKTAISGGISPIAGRLSIEGPLIKERSAFLFSARGSHSDLILHRVKIPELNNSLASFYDLNAKINHKIGENNELTISTYYSEDRFKLNFDTLYHYRNINGSINYKHTFSKKIYGTFSGIYSNYAYSLSSDASRFYSFNLDYDMDYKEGRADFTWFLNADHKLNFGANVIHYMINPGTRKPLGLESLMLPVDLPFEQAVETGLYLSDEFNISNRLAINYGIRYSGFLTLGPGLVYHYLQDAPRYLLSRIDSTDYPANKITNRVGGLEPRFSARYETSPSSSVKINLARTYQYLHMLTNTAAISPTDIWKVSGPNLPPQKSWQYSAGFYKDLLFNTVEASLEVYFKNSKDILEYRGGADLMLNPELEVDLLQGIGKAYGMEILFRRKVGAVNGWASYTYSRSLVKVDSRFLINQINQGKYFPSNFDKPHDFTLVTNYRFSRRHSISGTVTYSTGRPITYPVGKYMFRDREVIHYSNRNEYRIPDYFRWDLSLNIDGSLRSKRLIKDSVSISVYNVTGRDNVYSIFFVSDPVKKVRGYKLSVFAQPILSVSYNFRY